MIFLNFEELFGKLRICDFVAFPYFILHLHYSTIKKPCQAPIPTFYFESQLVSPLPSLSDTMNGMAKHITNDQRNEIYALKRAGHKQKDIAKLLHKSPSTVSRELARNKGIESSIEL